MTLVQYVYRRRMIKAINNRITEVQMLHISLGDYRWTLTDIWYVLTGRA